MKKPKPSPKPSPKQKPLPESIARLAHHSVNPDQQPIKKKSKLAEWGDPYVTADGKVIPPESLFNDPAKNGAGQTMKSSAEYRPQRKRSIPDLPAAPNAMKGIALVFTFTIMGVPDREIAEMLQITPSEVRQVRTHPGYGETFEVIASEFVSAKSKRLVSRIAAYAEGALDNVYNIAMNGQKENNVLKASIDLLDRAGVRPKDVAEGKGQQNELRITIVRGDSDAEVAVNGITIE